MLGIGLLALAAALLIVVRGVYEEHGGRQLRVVLEFAPKRAQRGDTVDLRLRVEHVGRLPVPWLVCHLELPSHLHSAAAQGNSLEARLAVPYRGGIVRHYPVTAAARGLYRIGRVRLDFSDPVGIVSLRPDAEVAAELLVHPHARDTDLVTPTRALIGEIERRSLLEDPSAFRGVRPYRPGDPLRRIHWPQTARAGELMAREYATAVDARLCLCLNLATHTPHWSSVDPARLEGAVEVAAGLAIEACARALPVGLLVNGVAFTPAPVTHVAPGASQGHLTHLLDVLARLAPYPSADPEAVVRAAAALGPETTLVFITGPLPDAWRRGLPALAATRDVALLVLATAEEPVPVLRGVRVVRLEAADGAAAAAAGGAP